MCRFAPSADVGLKWPNDLRVGRKKVGGILCEYEPRGGEIGAVAVGIGVNLKTPEGGYPEGILATSMEEAGCRLGGGEEMIGALLDRLGRCYRDFLGHGFEPLRRRWEGLCDGIGEVIEVTLAGESVPVSTENGVPSLRIVVPDTVTPPSHRGSSQE